AVQGRPRVETAVAAAAAAVEGAVAANKEGTTGPVGTHHSTKRRVRHAGLGRRDGANLRHRQCRLLRPARVLDHVTGEYGSGVRLGAPSRYAALGRCLDPGGDLPHHRVADPGRSARIALCIRSLPLRLVGFLGWPLWVSFVWVLGC